MNKILTLMTVLFMLSASTAFSQALCDKYHDKYRVCVEAGEAGSNLDYDDCATYASETACVNAGCYWNTQGLPNGACVIDICLADSDLSGRISGADLTVLKKALGRVDCETTPDIPPSPAPVPKTGQTTSYATGDDGDLEKGVAWPNPRFTIPGDNEDVVIDNLTGLMWTRDANLPNGTMTWSEALDYVQAMNGGVGSYGYTDWRLPNRFELESLLDLNNNSPALPKRHPFSNVHGYFYWTSTTYDTVTFYVWAVSMHAGNVIFDLKTVDFFYVWPVRGGND